MNTQTYSYPTGQSPNSITKTDNFIYITNKVDGSVTKYDLSGNILSTTAVDSLPVRAIAQGDKLYIAFQTTLQIVEYNVNVIPTTNHWGLLEEPVVFEMTDDYFLIASNSHVFIIEKNSGGTNTFNISDVTDALVKDDKFYVLTRHGKIYTIDPTTATDTSVGDWALSNAVSFVFHGPTNSFYVADYAQGTTYKLSAAPVKEDMNTGIKTKLYLFEDVFYMLDADNRYVVKATADSSGINIISVEQTGELPVDLIVDINHDLWVVCQNADVVNKIMYWVSGPTVPTAPVSELIEFVYNAPAAPSAITYDGANYWVVCQNANLMLKLSPVGTKLGQYNTDEQPTDVVYVGLYIYVVNSYTGNITKYNREGNRLAAYAITQNPYKIATDGAHLYIIDKIYRKLIKTDLNLNILTTKNLSYTPDNIGFIQGSVYVSAEDNDNFYKYDNNLNNELAVDIGYTNTKYFTTDGVYLFVASKNGATLFKMLYDGTILNQAPTNPLPTGVAYAQGYLNVITYLDGKLTRYDINLNTIDDYNVGTHPTNIYSDATYLWVLNEDNQIIKILSNSSPIDLLPEDSFIHFNIDTHTTDIKYDNGLFYLPSYLHNKLIIKSQTGNTIQEIPTGNKPYKVAVTPHSIFVYSKGENKIYVYNKSTYVEENSFTVGDNISSMVAEGDYVWLTSINDSKVYKIDVSGTIHFSRVLELSPVSIKYDGQKILVALSSAHKVVIIDPDSYYIESIVIPGINVVDMTNDNKIIALCQASNEFIKVNYNGIPVYSIKTNPGATQILFDGTSTWILEGGNNTISRYINDTKLGTYRMPNMPYAMAFDGTDLWVVSLYGGKLTRIIISKLDNFSGMTYEEARNYPDSFIATSEALNIPINDLKHNQTYFKTEIDDLKAIMKETAGEFEYPYERLNQIIDGAGNYIKGSVNTELFEYTPDVTMFYDDIKDVIYLDDFYWLLGDTRIIKVAQDLTEYDHYDYGSSYAFIKFIYDAAEGLFYVLGSQYIYKINKEFRIVASIQLNNQAVDFTFSDEDKIWVATPSVSTIEVRSKIDFSLVGEYNAGAGIQTLFYEPINKKIYAGSINNLIYRIALDGTFEDQYVGGVNPVSLWADGEHLFVLSKDSSSVVKINITTHDVIDTFMTLISPDKMFKVDSVFYITSGVPQGTNGAIDMISDSLYRLDTYSLPIYDSAKLEENGKMFFTIHTDHVDMHRLYSRDVRRMLGGKNISLHHEGKTLIINNDLDPEDFRIYARGDKVILDGQTDTYDIYWDGLYLWSTLKSAKILRKYNSYGALVRDIDLPAEPLHITNDGFHIYVGTVDNKIHKIDRFSEAIVDTWALSNRPRELMFFDGFIYVIMEDQALIAKYDPSGALVDSFGLTANGWSLTHDQTHIYASMQNNKLCRLDTNGTIEWEKVTEAMPIAIRFDGTTIWVAEHDHNTISKYALDGTKIASFSTNGAPMDISFVEEYVAVALEDVGKIAKYKSNGELVEEFMIGTNPIALSTDGPYIWISDNTDNNIIRLQLVDAHIKYIHPGAGVRFNIIGDHLVVSSSEDFGGSTPNPAGGNLIQEDLTDAVPDSNNYFTLQSTYYADSLRVYLAGIRLRPNVDYIPQTNNTFKLNRNKAAIDTLIVDYVVR